MILTRLATILLTITLGKKAMHMIVTPRRGPEIDVVMIGKRTLGKTGLSKRIMVLIGDCERDRNSLPSRLMEPPHVYAPERGPPLLDFLFVLTAFFAAAFAAFYTILSETGVK